MSGQCKGQCGRYRLCDSSKRVTHIINISTLPRFMNEQPVLHNRFWRGSRNTLQFLLSRSQFLVKVGELFPCELILIVVIKLDKRNKVEVLYRWIVSQFTTVLQACTCLVLCVNPTLSCHHLGRSRRDLLTFFSRTNLSNFAGFLNHQNGGMQHAPRKERTRIEFSTTAAGRSGLCDVPCPWEWAPFSSPRCESKDQGGRKHGAR